MVPKTIADLRIGDVLEFGRYSVSEAMTPERILWVKMTQNSDFITKYVIDVLMFDNAEANGTRYAYYGNPNFDVSNIAQFLNSELGPNEWFVPKNEEDIGPSMGATWREQHGYITRSGFLRYFEDGERDAIDSMIRLPYLHEIFGDDEHERAKLFKRGGVRAHGSDDFLLHKQCTLYSEENWISYYTMDVNQRNEMYIETVSRTGGVYHAYASNGDGIRPVCKLCDEAKVMLNDRGNYEIAGAPTVYQPQDINKLFGF